MIEENSESESAVALEEAPAIAPAEDAPAAALAPAEPAAEPSLKRWYVVKVASGREESIKAAILRRVKIDALEPFFGQIVIPVERITEVKKVKEVKNGEKITKEKRVVKERKKFPGYLMAEVEFNGEILTLFRDTSGVGDFVGATGPGKPPPPMSDIDVQRMLYGMLPGDQAKGKGTITVKLDFEKGDKVRIREGAFANYEGEVKVIVDSKEAGETPKVTVEVQVLGRPVPIELEYWQVDKM
jgi:transcriptional antiterminator NusG